MSINVYSPTPESIELKLGQKIKVILYQGINKVEVEAVLNYLKTFKDNNQPLPLKHTDFNMKIEDVITETSDDLKRMTTNYRIILKGELLECQR